MGGGFERKVGGSSLVHDTFGVVRTAPDTSGTPGKRTLTEQLPVVQCSTESHVSDPSGGSQSAGVQQAAARGITGEGISLPHRHAIQRLFGRHDISAVEAHVGGAAATASNAMGAEAYATGNHVAFASAPDLHTAAHEAAHVVQQRGGVQLEGGVGESGDVHEQHANAVADTLVQGKSAERLLDPYVSGSNLPAVPHRAGVQRKTPTHAVTETELGTRGEEQHARELTDKQVHDAIVWNDKHWTGTHRQELRSFLSRARADEGGFTEADVRAIRKIQLGAGVEPARADGMLGDTTMAILLHAGLTLDFDGKKPKAEDVQLLFIPGEFEDLARWQAAVTDAMKKKPDEPYRALIEPAGSGRVYVKVNGNIVDVVNARGGPVVTVKDQGGHTADPTTAGTWKLAAGKPVVTASWPASQIPWGAEVRKRPDGEWEFRDPDTAKWKVATGARSQLSTPLDIAMFEGSDDGQNKRRSTWRINDFGEMGWRIQGTDGQFIHTTPEDEEVALAGGSPELAASHGCVHLDPAGRTRLRDRGQLQAGVTFVVRRYTVHLLPAAMRQIMQGDKSLHDKLTP